MLVGDFKTEIKGNYIESFLHGHELSNLIKEETCFRNEQNPNCIDLILTSNSYNTFQQTATVCSGLSDCNKLVFTVLKRVFLKVIHNKHTYRDYKKFDSLKFNNELKDDLRKKILTIVLSLLGSFWKL